MLPRLTIVAALVILGLSACKGMSGEGTRYRMTFPSGTLEARLTTDHFTVHEAALETLEREFLYTITQERVDGRVGVIYATTAKNHRVRVESVREGSDLTLIKIHVGSGVGGDEEAQADILTRIERTLAGGVTAAPRSAVTPVDPQK